MQQRKLFVNLVGNRQIFCLKSLFLINLARDCLEVEILFIHVYVNYKKRRGVTSRGSDRFARDSYRLSYEVFINFSLWFSASDFLQQKCWLKLFISSARMNFCVQDFSVKKMYYIATRRWIVAYTLFSEFKQPRRRQWQERHNFVYLTMKKQWSCRPIHIVDDVCTGRQWRKIFIFF